MGKKDKKNRNDPEKKAAKQAKKEAKAEKSALKRLLKEQKRESQDNNDGNNNKNDDNNDIDEICQSFRKKDKIVDTPVVETLNAFPSRRANASLTVLPSGEMILFGGECYDGVENVVFDELYRWNPKKITTSSSSDDDNDDNKDDDGDKIPRGEWKVVYPPPPIPPPRCSHQSCIYDDQLYVFGGELATSSSYHHYRDLWRFDPSTNRWTLLTTTPGSSSKKQQHQCPPARSGHRMISYKHYLLLFGGFYEALRETKWYDDFWVYDCRTNVWKMMEYSVLAPRPSSRSGFGFGVWYGAGNGNSDVAVIYGGFCKLKVRDNTWERRVMNDAWICDLKVLDKGKSPSWERLGRKKGEYPSPRSGMSCVVYKGRLLVYGGVKDEEDNGHKVRSEFYDDLFALDGDSRRWFKMGLKTVKTKGRRRKKKEREEEDEEEEEEEEEKNEAKDEDNFDDENSDSNNLDSAGWDLDKLRSNMFAFIDGNGNIVYEKIEPDETKADDTDGYKADVDDSRHDKFGKNQAQERSATKTKDDNDDDDDINDDDDDDTDNNNNTPPAISSNNHNKPPTYKIIQSSEVMKVSSTTNLPEPIRRSSPLPRINAMTVVKGHTLYIYGGLLEVGDREVTLDDCWSIDLQKRERWDCIWEGTMHQQIWRGVESDEENSYVSSTGAESDDERDEDEEEDDNDVVLLVPTNDDDDEDNNNQQLSSLVESKKAKKKKSKKSSSSKGKTSIKDEISRLKNQLSLDDDYRTPRTKEVLADFYSRTTDYWNQQAAVATTTTAASAEDECAAAAAAADGPSMSQKELKRAGFALARQRYEELRPVLERLNELDEMLLQPDGDGDGGDDNDGKEKKKKKDKSKKKKDRRDRG